MKYNIISSIILCSTIMTPALVVAKQNTSSIKLVEAGRYQSNIFDQSAAEIVTFDKSTQQTFVVNAQSGQIDVINSKNIDNPTLTKHLNIKADIKQHLGYNAGSANSVDVHNGLLAVAIEAKNKTDIGWVAFYNTHDLSFISANALGSLPDMVTFTPNGKQVVVALEGEPSSKNYAVDPEGEIAIIDIDWNNKILTTDSKILNFKAFNKGDSRHSSAPQGLLLNGYHASISKDVEPEYIAVNEDSTKAYVALQENNAIAIIDLTTKHIDQIIALGLKDHLLDGNELDGNDKDRKALLSKQPLLGMYQPDSIATTRINGVDYLITANEGDDRSDWISGLSQAECEKGSFYYHLEDQQCADDIKLKDAFSSKIYDPNLPTAQLNLAHFAKGGSLSDTVNRIKFSHSMTAKYGDLDGDNKIDRLLTFGGRSFSIWDMNTKTMVFDSGSDFERITAEKYGKNFNQSHSKLKAEDRSAKKGPEPEALTVATINNKTYAFIGLERMGGIMVYDISQPKAAKFIQYLNTRDMSVDPKANKKHKNAKGIATYQIDAGDLGPEGFKFVTAKASPTGSPILIVGNEVSGTTRFYRIETE